MKKLGAALVILSAFCSTFGFASGVNWVNWSDELFEKATQEKKLVLLDLEAVWCHWCHVMEHQTYANPKVAEILGKHFIAVKVDQDSRPDLSLRYEDYGWPATIIFDSKGKELVKRSGFFPPEQMISLLNAVIADPTPGPSVHPEATLVANPSPFLSDSLRKELRKIYVEAYDDKHGGWGTVHKLIPPETLEYALRGAIAYNGEDAKRSRETLTLALNLKDPVWGGFYQYSVGGDWHEPHFEKIASVQADALRLYSQAYALWSELPFKEAAISTQRYLSRFFRSPDGAFYTSQDADLVPGEHSDEYFKLNDRERLKKGKPRVDIHRYARENGWIIEGLCRLYSATGDEEYLKQARHAEKWITSYRSLPNGGYRHDEKDAAGPYLGDTLAMGRAHLVLYEVTAERAWLEQAKANAAFIQANFSQEAGKNKAFGFGTTKSSKALAARPHRDENILLARFANLLYQYTGEKAFRETAQQAMRFIAIPRVATERPVAAALLADAEMTSEPLHITVVGSKKDAMAGTLFRSAMALPDTYKRVEWWDKSEGALPRADVTYPELPKPAAFICTQNRCSLPIFKADQLRTKVDGLAKATKG